ncbi:MAG: hypothetical protein ACWGN1_06845 [Desulfobulbales bacterium]
MKLPILAGCALMLVLASAVHARLTADYVFTDLDGKIYTPGTLKGRPVVIYVGSTF